MSSELFVMVTLALAAIVIIWVIIKMSYANPPLYSIRAAAVLLLGVLLIAMLISLAIELDRWQEANDQTVESTQ